MDARTRQLLADLREFLGDGGLDVFNDFLDEEATNANISRGVEHPATQYAWDEVDAMLAALTEGGR
jgi:hypothetical protein